jgi:hypothetical protein
MLDGATNGRRPGSHFVENDTQREDVCSRAGLGPAGLLRRHIGRCAENGAWRRVLPESSRAFGRLMVDDPREPEIEHLHVAVAPDHDVLGLDVPMDDAGRVSGGQRARHLPSDIHRRRLRLRGLDESTQRLAVDELLHDEELAAGCLPDFVDGDDVGVIEG